MTALKTLATGLAFPEGPRWHDGKLWFSDFYTHKVQAVGLDGRIELKATVPQRPSGLGFLPDGSLLVVSMLDRSVLRVRDGKASLYADLSSLAGGWCNDMIVDAKGRAYVGNFGYDKHKGEALRNTCLIRIDPDGRTRVAADDLTFPNGCAITPDGKRMIVGETFANRLTSFDITPDGTLSNRRVFATVEGCNPDGICLDAEGAIWIADPHGKRMVRVFEGGRVDRQITFEEGRGAYACVLGGPDRKTLFILTNSGSGPQMVDRRDGRIEYLSVPVAGAGIP